MPAARVDTLRTSTRVVVADAWLWEALFAAPAADARPSDRAGANALGFTGDSGPARRRDGGAAARVGYGDVRIAQSATAEASGAARTIFYRGSASERSADAHDSAMAVAADRSAVGTRSERRDAPLDAAPPWRVPRIADLMAAPFIPDRRELDGAGRILGGWAPAGSQMPTSRESSDRLGYGSHVALTAPQSQGAVRGARFLVFRSGGLVEDARELALPTAVLEVEAPATRTRPAIARVAAAFDSVRAGQGVLALPTALSSSVSRALPVDDALARVTWRQSDSGSANVVVLDLTAASGFRPGDAVSLVARGRGANGADVEIATAVLLRVNETAASALIVRETRPQGQGTVLARVTAKLP
jgi:hypothetical protein